MVKIWDPKDFKRSNLYRFLTYVNQKYGLTLSSYASLHKWSVENVCGIAATTFRSDVSPGFPLNTRFAGVV